MEGKNPSGNKCLIVFQVVPEGITIPCNESPFTFRMPIQQASALNELLSTYQMYYLVNNLQSWPAAVPINLSSIPHYTLYEKTRTRPVFDTNRSRLQVRLISSLCLQILYETYIGFREKKNYSAAMEKLVPWSHEILN